MLRSRPLPLRLASTMLVPLLVVTACTNDEAAAPGAGPGSTSSSTSAASPSGPSSAPPDGAAPDGAPVRPTFFGMHEGRVTQGVTPDAPVGSLRFWDSGTSWLHLETSPGRFEWGALDTAVTAAEASGARPMLVLGQTPAFHSSRPKQEAAYAPGAAAMPDPAAWRRYVTAVAERYRDRIDYQVWNEANVVGYWAGTPRQMAELTLSASEAIHRVVPDATVVAPPFALRLASQQRYFADFWALQSEGIDLASAVDAVAVHLYPLAEDPPEAQVKLFGWASRLLAEHQVGVPVWNTEVNYGLMGGLKPPPIPAERQRAFLMRTYLLGAGLGIQRVYWYRWDLVPIANTLLTTPDFSAQTSAGLSFRTIRGWLEGATVQPCEASSGVWACTATVGLETRTFWWKPQGRATQIQAGEDARSWTDADGVVTPCRGCEVPVGETPVMVTSR